MICTEIRFLKVYVFVILPLYNSSGLRVHASIVYDFPDFNTADTFARMFKYVPEHYIRIISGCIYQDPIIKGFRYPDGSFVDSLSFVMDFKVIRDKVFNLYRSKLDDRIDMSYLKG